MKCIFNIINGLDTVFIFICVKVTSVDRVVSSVNSEIICSIMLTNWSRYACQLG